MHTQKSKNNNSSSMKESGLSLIENKIIHAMPQSYQTFLYFSYMFLSTNHHLNNHTATKIIGFTQ